MTDKPFDLDLAETAGSSIQCSVCGQPNVFGKLCSDCTTRLAELEAADDATRRTYLALGMRCVATEFPQEVGE
jgi:hypothetical protein